MKRLWLALLLLVATLVLVDAGLSAWRWQKIDRCLDRGLRFDYPRQACRDEATSSSLLWWSANQTHVRSLRTFALAGFFSVGVLLIRRNRVTT